MVHGGIRADIDASTVSCEGGGIDQDRRVIRHRHAVSRIVLECAAIHSNFSSWAHRHSVAACAGDVEAIEVNTGRGVHVQRGEGNAVTLNGGSLSERRGDHEIADLTQIYDFMPCAPPLPAHLPTLQRHISPPTLY